MLFVDDNDVKHVKDLKIFRDKKRDKRDKKPTLLNMIQRDQKTILLMITDDKTWHYLLSLSKSICIALNHNEDFYCFNFLYLFRTKNNVINVEIL